MGRKKKKLREKAIDIISDIIEKKCGGNEIKEKIDE